MIATTVNTIHKTIDVSNTDNCNLKVIVNIIILSGKFIMVPNAVSPIASTHADLFLKNDIISIVVQISLFVLAFRAHGVSI